MKHKTWEAAGAERPKGAPIDFMLENAARFPLSHRHDGYEKVTMTVVSEGPNPEKVSLSLD